MPTPAMPGGFSMTEESIEGIEVQCPVCAGMKKLKITRGFFGVTTEIIPCENCKGKGTISVPFICTRMSLPRSFYISGSSDSHGDNQQVCIGKGCHLWDHDNGGGCLERKAMIKACHGGSL
jgi:hypothetical protein